MTTIYTIRGDLDEALLTKTTGSLDNEDERTTWEEWRVTDDPTQEIVKRNVHVTLKKASVFAISEAGNF